MAIERPEGSKKPTQIKGKDPVAVAAVLDDKKKSLAAKKKSAEADAKKSPKKTSATSKKATAAKKSRTSTAKKKAAPKLPKNEREWINYLDGMKLPQLIAFLESKAGKLNVTAQTIVQKRISELTQLITALPSDYNGWLDYFSSMTPDETELFLLNHVLSLDNEAVAAGKRWAQIYENPALIDRMVTSKLQQEKSQEVGSILTAAKSGDRIKTFEVLRDNLAYKLEDGSGARDMTVLIKQLNETMVTLDELYRERGDKDDGNSSIRKLLIRSRKMASRPRARQAAMTIAEAEAEEDDE